MKKALVIACSPFGLAVHGQAFEKAVAPLVETSCIDCHDADTETPLDFEALGHDLSDADTFRRWVKVFDRVRNGEMPPKNKPRPKADLKDAALAALEADLRAANLKQQESLGRALARRLTRLEFEYTLRDLLGVRGDLARHLPPENASATFANVAEKQGLSPVHVRSYLKAVDAALDEAIELGREPLAKPFKMDYLNNLYSRMWFDRPLRRGGGTVMEKDGAYVMFDFRPHVAQSNRMGYRPPAPGLYRITAEASGYQAKTPVTFGLYRNSDKQGVAQLVGAFEIPPEGTRQIELTTYFTPQDFFYPAVLDANWEPNGKGIFNVGAKDYKGEGLAIRWLKIQGPLEKEWPPTRTRQLFPGLALRRNFFGVFRPVPKKEPREYVRAAVARLAPLAFRRPVTEAEVEAFVALAEPALAKKKGVDEAVRAPLRALFSSPQFLFHASEPGPLDDRALATRLSYFLWKTSPDEELRRFVREKKLTTAETLAGQVDRMLNDPRSDRFIHDFLDGWLHLRDIDATTPDKKLFPEFDDHLRQAMLAETRLFLRELLAKNLPARNFIKSDFTFLNRRLARHYGIEGVAGERMRRAPLPEDSLRGGLMTQASILKITANGTLTSPVKRGHWVLASLLGTPPRPPPPTIAALEPDTRGAVTIRETLAKHRDMESCAACHRHIDPPGFALESFNPIGGYRERYRTTGKGDWTTQRIFGRPVWEYRWTREVNAGGVTAEGEKFAGIRRFRDLLLKKEEQVARHFTSQLVACATGAEVQFADRAEVERILAEAKPKGYRVRDLLHAVAQSRLFLNK